MKLSTRTRYGTRAAVELALTYPEVPVSVKDMAERQRLSVKYLEQIMRTLKAAGLVRAVQGTHGGYALTREPATITLNEVFNALEGSPCLVECVNRQDACPMENICPTRDTWVELTRALTSVLEGTTLQDLAERQQQKIASRTPMYYI